MVGDDDFTIVSNNCWGAHVYQALGIPYATPFVGLFLDPASYLALLHDFDRLMRAELVFVDASRSAAINAWRERDKLAYPIGRLGTDVEINFQHYADAADAAGKWRRRAARMAADPTRRFFKFDDRESATDRDLEAFASLPFPHKVCFTASPRATPSVVVPAGPGDRQVVDGVALAVRSSRYFNTLRWISTAPRWLPLPSLL